ncbi:MAG: hypothetical protein KDK10_18345 [Maritimibacter sp.]|nr:hypothetical protein [Maritimibacter sp.]
MAQKHSIRHRVRPIAAIGAGLFGVMTIFAAGAVLFGPGRAVAGDVVPFVLWVNLSMGFVYVAAAILLWRRSPHARHLALVIAAITALAGVAFGAVALSGTPVEPRTAGALVFRALFWLAIAAIAPRRAP